MLNNNFKRRILLTAETGFIIRNILLGNFIDYIDENTELVVAVKNPDDSKLKEIMAKKNVNFISLPQMPAPVLQPEWKKYFLFQYWIFLFFIANKNTESIKTFYKIYENQKAKKQQFANNLIIKIGKIVKWLRLKNLIERVYLYHYGKHSVTSRWIEILSELKPDVVVSTILTLTHRHQANTDLPMILAAKKLDIPAGTLIQSWDNLSSKPSVLPPWLDRFWTWSEIQAKELKLLYPTIPSKNIRIVGSPQFDFHLDGELIEDRRIFLGNYHLDPNDRYLLFCTGTPRLMPDEIEKIIVLIEKLNSLHPELQFLIRLHPKDHSKRINNYLDKLKSLRTSIQYSTPDVAMDAGGFVPPKDFYKEQVNSIYHADIVLNSSSTITVDTAIINRPVICLAYDIMEDPKFPEGLSYALSKSDHYSLLVKTGGVTVVRSEDECIGAIDNYLNNPNLHSNERKKLVKAVTEFTDGSSGKRFADEVLKLAKAK